MDFRRRCWRNTCAKVAQSLETKSSADDPLSISAHDSILRGIELPLLPVSQMRQMLQLNSKAYLQHDLSDHTFDCYIVPNDPKKKTESVKGSVQKFKVMEEGRRCA